MKKIQGLLFMVSPLILGFLYEYITLSFYLETMWCYIISTGLLLYWMFVGAKFAKLIKKSFLALFTGNIIGIASLIVYYFQFEAQNITTIWWLKYFCQCFVFPTFIFTKNMNPVISFSQFSISPLFFRNIIGLLCMIVIFYIGYFIKKSFFNKGKYSSKKRNTRKHC